MSRATNNISSPLERYNANRGCAKIIRGGTAHHNPSETPCSQPQRGCPLYLLLNKLYRAKFDITPVTAFLLKTLFKTALQTHLSSRVKLRDKCRFSLWYFFFQIIRPLRKKNKKNPNIYWLCLSSQKLFKCKSKNIFFSFPGKKKKTSIFIFIFIFLPFDAKG